MKKNNKKGFTLAELLIVVAIIAVLVAVAIPIFSSQLERARDATSVANMRSAYAEAMTEYLTGDNAGTSSATVSKSVKIQTAQANSWSEQGGNLPFTAPADNGDCKSISNKTITFTITNTSGSTAVTAALS